MLHNSYRSGGGYVGCGRRKVEGGRRGGIDLPTRGIPCCVHLRFVHFAPLCN